MTTNLNHQADSGSIPLSGDQRLSENIDPEEFRSASDVVQTLNRAIKTLCLYPDGNSISADAQAQFLEAVSRHIERYRIITLTVRDNCFAFHGESLQGQSPDDNSLAKLCFESGIFELSFSDGFNAETTGELLQIFRSLIAKERIDVDLAEALWGEDFTGFAYNVIEDIPIIDFDDELKTELFKDQHSDDESGLRDPADREFFSQIFTSADPEGDPRSPGDSSERFESTLTELAGDSDETSEPAGADMPTPRAMLNSVFTLEAKEAQEAASEVARDATFLEDRELALICIDLLEENEALPDFADALYICLRTHGKLIETGRLTAAAELTRVLRRAESALKDSKPNWAAKAKEALATIGSRERLAKLASALNDHQDIDAAQLNGYLQTLDWTSYAALIETLGTLESRAHRMTVCEHFSDVDEEHLDLIASGIYDKRWYVVRNSVTILSQYNHKRAHKHLLKALVHTDIRVRKEALDGLSSQGCEFICQALSVCIDDSDSEIREAALELASKQQGSHVFDLFTKIAERQNFGSMPKEFRAKILQGFSRSGGARAVPALIKWIAPRSFFLSKEKRSLRTQALSALSRNTAPEATVALRRLSSAWVSEVRQMVRLIVEKRTTVNSPGDH